MKRITTPPLERRLQERYVQLVKSHMHGAPKLAAGVKSLPGVASSFAATQAAWRFLNNDRVTLAALVEPLREAGCRRTEAIEAQFVMLAHDWCKLGFSSPKKDEVQLTHENDIGYDLTTALLVSPDDGSPLAPMEMHLRTARRTLSTREPAPRKQHHLEQVLPTMNASHGWELCKPVLHVIDREADSVDHYRRWDQAGHKFLIRGDDRRVKWNGQSLLLDGIRDELRAGKAFKHVGKAKHQGRKAQLWVAETDVVLYRPAKKNVKGNKVELPGRPLTLRFIVVQLRDSKNRLLAEWKLLSNAPLEWADAALLARCYYWRWRIESFFKLLKSHGCQLEQWQQQTGPAIARRLLIAAMACVVVWELQVLETESAGQFRAMLIQLSGRQMKHDCSHTAPALLAGLWTLFSMLELLNHYQLNEIKTLAGSLPFFNTG